MKKMIYMACMCAFSIGLLSGCGGEFVEEMEVGKDASRALTGAAVSGQAVSGQAVQTDGDSDSPEKDAEQKGSQGVLDSRCCTEGYYYTSSCEDYIDQISLETGKRRKFKVDESDEIMFLVCVEKDVLYCIKYIDINYSGLWQIPIERHEDGSEELKTDREEMIKGLDDIYSESDYIYVDDTYIVYSGGNDEATDVICYKRESGEKVRMPADNEAQGCTECDILRIYRKGDCLELVTMDGIVTWDVRTGKVSVCGDKEDLAGCLDETDLVSTEKACFYIVGAMDVLRIDMETKKKTDFVPKKEFWDVLETEVGIQKKQIENVYIHDLYYDENCLYIELHIDYEKEGKSYEGEIILSREDTEGAPLQYEKGLTEYLWDDNGKRGLYTGKAYVASKSCCYGVRRGTAYVSWARDEEVDKVIYDLKTGEARPVSWQEELMFE